MKRLISSRLTFVYKFIFPLLCMAFAACVILAILASIAEQPAGILFFLFLAAGFAAWSLWLGFRYKTVELDDNYLYVAGYRKKAQIPLGDVMRVEESILWSPKQIILRLKNPSVFGNTIVFIPHLRAFESIRLDHPIVAELVARTKAEKGEWF